MKTSTVFTEIWNSNCFVENRKHCNRVQFVVIAKIKRILNNKYALCSNFTWAVFIPIQNFTTLTHRSQ